MRARLLRDWHALDVYKRPTSSGALMGLLLYVAIAETGCLVVVPG